MELPILSHLWEDNSLQEGREGAELGESQELQSLEPGKFLEL